jgi:hypothetical protein
MKCERYDGGAAQCKKCGEWYNNLSSHTCSTKNENCLDKDKLKERTFSYRDMLECWTEARKNLVEWGVGPGDKPDFGSWVRNRFK